MTDNPFDQLGLKKDVVRYLHDQGRLGSFLKGYLRVAQSHLHPDTGGDTHLSALVNAAYAQIQQQPSKVGDWLATMQNGSNPEYLGIIEALTGEVERLQKVEKEFDELRQEHARVLAGEAIETPLRTTFGSRTRDRSEGPHIRTPPRVRTPPESRAESRSEPRPPAPSPSAIYAGHVLMPRASTWARGAEELRAACALDSKSTHPMYSKPDGSRVYRPLTFKEDIEARVTNFETTLTSDGTPRTMAQRLFLMSERWIDSCTGTAYKAGTTKFKVIPQCAELINLHSDFASSYIAVSYSSQRGTELDSAARRAKYNEPLKKSEIIDHSGWRAAMEDDVTLLRNYFTIVFEALKERSSDKKMPEKAMSFRVRQNTDKDELRALLVSYLDGNSDAGGDDLNYVGSFLRVAHR